MAEQPRHGDPSNAEQTGRPAYTPGETSPEQDPTGTSVHYRESEQRGGYEPGHTPTTPHPPRAGQPVGSGDAPGWTIFGRRISWGAIFAGVVIAIGVQILLTTLGIGTGAAAFDPLRPGDPEAWTVGIGLWWLITGLIALFIGGWIAAHLSSNPDRMDGALHGLATWGLVSIIGIWLAGTAVGAATAGAWQVFATAADTERVAIVLPELVNNNNDVELDPELERELREVDEAVAQAGFWSFSAMLLGAVVAALGGFLAAPGSAASAVTGKGRTPPR